MGAAASEHMSSLAQHFSELPAWLRRFSMSVGTCLIIGTAAGMLRLQKRRKQHLETLANWADAEFRVAEELVELMEMESACVEHGKVTDLVRFFSRGAANLAQIWSHTGTELQQLCPEIGSDCKSDVGKFFVAWHDVGTANISFSDQLLSLSASLNQVAIDADMTRTAIRSDTHALRQALLEVIAAPLPIATASWGLARLIGRTDVAAYEKHKEEKEFLLKTHWSVTSASIKDLIDKLNADKASVASAIAEGVADARRWTKPVGCGIAELMPLDRDETEYYIIVPSDANTASRDEADQEARRNSQKQKRASGTRGKLIDGLIKTLSTPESRQQHIDEEDAANPIDNAIFANVDAILPPLEDVGPSIWRVRRIYEHQALKMGLRWLDKAWTSQDSNQLQHLPDGLFRARLLRDLLAGSMTLQSITGNDVSAAQRDLQALSLPQLLRLRVLHLDFLPSGTGSNSVSAVGGTHEAFLSTLDGLLFRQLGKHVLGELAHDLAPQVKTLLPIKASFDEHRLGREAMLLCAVGASLNVSPWWSWWITVDRRIFFNALSFTCSKDYPVGSCGVLEVTDFSSGDKHEPTGRLRWLDWRVMLIACEADLSDVPLRGQPTSASTTITAKGDMTENATSPTVSGAGIAQMLSPELLRGTRGSLRKTFTSHNQDETREV